MLQQTTTTAVVPYFAHFTGRWPGVRDLAAADDAEVMQAWAGLGYYARARNLLRCAREVALERGGAFPTTADELARLPGVGPYTAAAVAAIAFGEPANVVDGNVERVVSRLHAEETPLPAAKPLLTRFAARLVAPDRPGDWAQALMDLGATVCTPRRPNCGACPLRGDCAASASSDPSVFPRRRAKAARPTRHGAAFVILDGGCVALERRPGRGLLGGMPGVPTGPWREGLPPGGPQDAPFPGAWREAGGVRHVFTHFALELRVYWTRGPPPPSLCALEMIPIEAALSAAPTLFRKVIRAACEASR